MSTFLDLLLNQKKKEEIGKFITEIFCFCTKSFTKKIILLRFCRSRLADAKHVYFVEF